ncbi:hypothetical protein GCM10017673_13930 [Streptosporangium violaceochromogenes]|nr:hypothetical protein GCM10017673_13930 [Streptosporangium violaceochromogenes]
MREAMQTVRDALIGLADDHATGALRLGRIGTLYLVDGRVTHAESAVSPAVEDLLTACGRISAHAVRQARQAATAQRPGGERLISQGVLTRGELELCALGALLDAAYFLLGATVHRPGFQPGARHWLGARWHLDVTELSRECERRRRQLDQVWPSTELDALPVVPVGRVPAQAVVLTPLQWEVVVGADAAATPADLAHRLGRPAYSVLLAVRQLAAAGLLRLPKGRLPAGSGVPPGGTTGPLPRRVAGTGAIREAVTGGLDGSKRSCRLPQATANPADVDLLVRLKKALEALA